MEKSHLAIGSRNRKIVLMIKIFHVVVISFLSLWVAGCKNLLPVSEAGVQGIIPLNYLPALNGDYFKIDSGEVGRLFHIYVRFPAGYSEQNKTYPVVYLLDGDSLFPIVAANYLFLTYDEGLT